MSERYEELLAEGRRETPAQREANLRSLAADPRFASVVGLIDELRESYVTAGSKQSMAEFHGCLAHCMGSIEGLRMVLQQLKGVMGKRKG